MKFYANDIYISLIIILFLLHKKLERYDIFQQQQADVEKTIHFV